MTETILRTALAWAGLVVLLRLSGRRTLGEMSAVDLVVLLIAGDMVQQSLLGEDASLTSAFVVVITLLLLSVSYAGLKTRFPGAVRTVEGAPTVLVREGVPDTRQMKSARVTMDDVLEAARGSNILEAAQVRYAILETDGIISVIPYPEAKPPD